MRREFRIPDRPPEVVVVRPPELTEQVCLLCGAAPDFLVYRVWSVKRGMKAMPAHIIVRTCVPPEPGVDGSVTFSPDHDADADRQKLSWEEFFETYEPSPGTDPYVPYMHDPIIWERYDSEGAERAQLVTTADHTVGRVRYRAAQAREADPGTRVNS
jgi:hypothetical protein